MDRYLKPSAVEFRFYHNNKPTFKFYQDNDPKNKELNVRSWLLYNCDKMINTPPQSPDLYPIQNSWVYLKKKVAKRQLKNSENLIHLRNDTIFHWNIPKLVRSKKKRIQHVVNGKGGHTKYLNFVGLYY